MTGIAIKCPNCATENPDDARRCLRCNYPFTYSEWLREGGLEWSIRIGLTGGLVIAATIVPIAIGLFLCFSGNATVAAALLLVALSAVDATILYRVRHWLARFAQLGQYEKKTW